MWELFVPLIGKLFDKILPDQQAAADAKMKLAQMAQDGQLAELNAMTDLAKAQLSVNQAEAQSDGWFKGGWRPAIGYVLCFALAYQYILSPLLFWACTIWYPTIKPPAITMDENMWQLIFGMLGLAATRTWEKKSLAAINSA